MSIIPEMVPHADQLDGDGAHSRPGVRPLVRALLVAAIVSAVALPALFFLLQTPRDQQLRTRMQALLPEPALSPRPQLTFPTRSLYLEIGRYSNELEAYAALAELRRTKIEGKFLLSASREGDESVLRAELPDDLLAAVPRVERLRASGVIDSSDWAVSEPGAISQWWDQSRIFEQTYSEVLQSAKVPRRTTVTPVADIVRISSFFGIPLRVFVLENPDSEQDRQPRWRSHAQPSDVVLARSQGRVLSMPRNSVEWGETSAALQHAHGLYLRSVSNYTPLPARFRPPAEFREELPPPVLLTYAGVLLKDLADKSPAEAPAGHLLSIPPDDPNVRRKVGVRRATLHASRALAHALLVNRQILLEMVAHKPSHR